jgi:HEAT repeat protein
MRAVVASTGLVLALMLSGCGQYAPVVVHGRPVSHWVEALQSPDAKMRKRAAEALGSVGQADPAALPALIEAVRDPDVTVRGAAVLCLLRLGPAARDAVPALEAVVRDDADLQVRDYAAKALKQIGAAP